MNFQCKNKNKRNNPMTLILMNLRYDPEQYSKGFSHRPDILRNANAGGTVTFKPYNSNYL